jgi:hypothetical protein
MVEKVKALFAKTPSRGATVQEAASAAAMAHRLMLKYKIALDEIEDADPELIEGYQVDLKCTTHDVAWHRDLFHGIARYSFCKSVTFSGTLRVAVVGEKQNAEFVKWLYESVHQEINQLWATENLRVAHVLRVVSAKERIDYKWGFIIGAVKAVLGRLKAQYDEIQAKGFEEERLREEAQAKEEAERAKPVDMDQEEDDEDYEGVEEESTFQRGSQASPERITALVKATESKVNERFKEIFPEAQKAKKTDWRASSQVGQMRGYREGQKIPINRTVRS